MKKTNEVKNEQTSMEETQKQSKQKMSPFGHLFRLIGLWFGFTGLYSMFSVCPFCGQQGCPTGIASAGIVGTFFTLCLQDWKRLFRFLKEKRHKRE